MNKKIAIIATLLSCLFPFFVSAAYKLPDTGQTKCYQTVSPYAEIPCEGTGQDGAYNINPMSFTDNGDGTVTDNNTGLMWQKCSVGQNNESSCSGSAVAYYWYQAAGVYDASSNPSTQNVCGSLDLAGHTDWRLPTDLDLMSIVDYSVLYPGPTIRQSVFPNTVASNYWSSTTSAVYPENACFVSFMSGDVDYYFKGFDGNFYVRCVRGGQ